MKRWGNKVRFRRCFRMHNKHDTNDEAGVFEVAGAVDDTRDAGVLFVDDAVSDVVESAVEVGEDIGTGDDVV